MISESRDKQNSGESAETLLAWSSQGEHTKGTLLAPAAAQLENKTEASSGTVRALPAPASHVFAADPLMGAADGTSDVGEAAPPGAIETVAATASKEGAAQVTAEASASRFERTHTASGSLRHGIEGRRAGVAAWDVQTQR